MGTGKKVKCNDCGAEWIQLYGVGFDGTPAENTPNEDEGICPECGSKNISENTDIAILWD